MDGVNISNQLTQIQKTEVAKICYYAFRKKFSTFILYSSDEQIGIPCIHDLIDFDTLFIATRDSKALGYIGLGTAKIRFMRHKVAVFVKHFGFLGGLYRAIITGLFTLLFDRIHKGTLHIESVAVSDEARGLGIGTMLLNAAFDEAKKRELHNITLDVVDTNPNAQKLYEKLGFNIKKVINTGSITKRAGFAGITSMCKMID